MCFVFECAAVWRIIKNNGNNEVLYDLLLKYRIIVWGDSPSPGGSYVLAGGL